jgi:hypothetical protein
MASQVYPADSSGPGEGQRFGEGLPVATASRTHTVVSLFPVTHHH